MNVNLKLLISCILEVAPGKKITYRNPDFYIAYGDPVLVRDGVARGYQTLFSFTDVRSFLHGLCGSKLILGEAERRRILELYFHKLRSDQNR